MTPNGTGVHLNGWWKGAALAVLAVCSLFWAGYTFNRVVQAEENAVKAANSVTETRDRVIRLEENAKAIKESLEEIKSSLKELNASVRRNAPRIE